MLQSYILSITEAHTIAGIHTKRASKHPCMLTKTSSQKHEVETKRN
nr:MAG TPA: hypothetical protein [Caudoviricetes sp.]